MQLRKESLKKSLFSQSDVHISAGVTDICKLAVAVFDFINCSLSVAWFPISPKRSSEVVVK